MRELRITTLMCRRLRKLRNYSLADVAGHNNYGIINLQIRRRFAYIRRAIFTRYCRSNVRHKATSSFYEGHAC